MSDLTKLVSTDSRTPIEKLRRHWLRQIAQANGVKVPLNAPKTQLVKLLEGAGIEVTRSVGNLRWQQHQQYDEDGRPTGVALQPTTPDPASARLGVTDEVRMSVAAAQAEAQEEKERERFNALELENLKAENQRLKDMIETRLGELEKVASAPPPAPEPPVLPIETMTVAQLQILCEHRGIKYTKTMRRNRLLSLLEATDEQDTA